MRHVELDRESLRVAMGARTWTEMAEQLGADYRTVMRAADGLTIAMADRWAIAAGLHPIEVWPAWLDITTAERRARQAARMRRYRATERGREANRQACAAYYAQCSTAARTKRRRRYATDPEPEKAAVRARYRANGDAIRSQRRQKYRLAIGRAA